MQENQSYFARCDLQNKTICDLSLENEVIEYKPTELQQICSSDDETTDILISKRMKSGLIIPNFKAYLYQIYFTPYQAASILFHLDPYGSGNEVINSDIKAIQAVLIQYIENGILTKSKIDTVQDDTLGNIKTAQIHREDLAEFAEQLNIPEFVNFPDIPKFSNVGNTLPQQANQTAELQARIAELEKALETANNQKPTSEQSLEYDGDIPLKTDKDKLAHTFKLIIQQSKFIEMNDGKYPTYSQLHTMLNHIYPNEPTPAKNTLKKYLEP
ncbi:MAG: hypothetical protein Q4A60_07345 [Pasteurellaceae bacterium]|nr:hypothetical protein [Pasteurellaceae bacterium]